MTRVWNLPDVPVLAGDEDLGSYLRRLGFTHEQLEYTRRSFANATGDSMAYISAQSALEELRDTRFGSGDFRILDGYDCLLNDLAQGLDVRLGTVVTSIDWSGAGVRVRTDDGAVFEGEQAVITLPLGVLQAGSVTFTPALPAEKQTAIRNLRMGPVIKLVYRFNQRITDDNVAAIYSALNPPMWWSPSVTRETPVQVWTAFLSGDWARELLALGEAGALEQGLKTLRTELQRPDLQADDAYLVNWPAEPFTLGGYSVAQPGYAGARAQLAQTTANRLYWAGEATETGAAAATVHGAYLSGQRVARDILAKADS